MRKRGITPTINSCQLLRSSSLSKSIKTKKKRGKSEAVNTLPQLYFFVVFSNWSTTLLCSRVHLLSAPGVLTALQALVFLVVQPQRAARIMPNSIQLWLSIWRSWLCVCRNQLPAEERRGKSLCVCVCVRVLTWLLGEPIHKRRHSTYAGLSLSRHLCL